MKKAILILFMCAGIVYAQDRTKNVVEEEKFEYNAFKEKVYFWQLEKNWKVTPLEVVSAVPTFGIDLETTMKERMSFQYGAAFIPSFFQPAVGDNPNQFDRMNGYKLRFEGRIYPFKKETRYFSSELSFRHLIIRDEMAVGQEPDMNGNFAYFTTEDVRAHRFSTQLNLKMGIQKVYENRFVLDFYWGLSLRNNSVAGLNTLADDAEVQGDWNSMGWVIERGHVRNYAVPMVGIKLGFHTPAKKNL
jgi:hypothetical protein